ncbi:helix-turn-helix domain-containing protein [Phenylobacterium sp.]|uniref:helix-turn-helix domain-containing protein n=1 Tax=Phenylobacterium sp. TaxID=1871053 RepID=UPI0035B28912
MTFRQIPLSWAERRAAGAVASGLSLDGLFERALIAPRFGDDRDQISPLQLILFFAALVLETDDGTHALLRRRVAPTFGPLGFRILFGAASLGDGLIALAKFHELSSSAIRLQLSTEGEQAFLALQVEDDRGGAHLQEDIQLTYLYMGLTCFLGRPFPALWVGTRDPEHCCLGSTHYAIRGPVGVHACAGIAFPKALLARRAAGPGLDEFAWRPMQEAISLLEMTPDHPPPGVNNRDLRLERLAAEQMMSPSTYRRMLVRNGSGFRQLRERALLDVTLDLLKAGSHSLEAIAADLGYADARSLRRFVKRATGRTPSEIRQDFASAVSPELLCARMKEIVGLMQL